MDPEQIYTEVLQEEQQKGSAGPVAEGRAKAARQRALQGSPHPKEPRWWEGAQPHLEGGGDAEPAAEAPAAEAPAAEEPAEAPAAEAPAAEAPAAEAPAAEAPAEAPAAAAAPSPEAGASLEPATQGGDAPVADQVPAPERTSTPSPAPVPAEVAAAAATAPAAARASGVTHGTPTGNRLRPEDAVSTEAQFQGQRAMYDRRKLIDELIATGVPEVSAQDGARRGSPLLALLYIIIPILAVMYLVAQSNERSAEAEPAGGPAAESPAAGGEGEGAITLVAPGIEFDKTELTIPADEEVSITLDNQSGEAHDLAFYENQDKGFAHEDPLWKGDEAPAGASTTYTTSPLPKGNYYFQCDIHVNMHGDLKVE